MWHITMPPVRNPNMILLLCAKNPRTKQERNYILKMCYKAARAVNGDKTGNNNGSRVLDGKVIIVDLAGNARIETQTTYTHRPLFTWIDQD